MIDFDKLKRAYALAEERNFSLSSEIRMIEDAYACSFHILDNVNKIGNQYFNVDSLLKALENRFQEGHMVWTYTHGKIVSWTIESIHWEPEHNDYRVNLETTFGKGSFLAGSLFSTKEELIEAQIRYWISQKSDLITQKDIERTTNHE
jgi:hypothetical protein